MAAELGRLERGHPDSEFLPFLNSGNYSLLFKFWNVAPKVRVCVCVCVCARAREVGGAGIVEEGLEGSCLDYMGRGEGQCASPPHSRLEAWGAWSLNLKRLGPFAS